MFTFIHLNFEWKHSNLWLRVYLHWINIIDKYKMITKLLRPLIQVNSSIVNEAIRTIYLFIYFLYKDILHKKTYRLLFKYLNTPKSIIKHTSNFHITPRSIIKHTSNFRITPRSIKKTNNFSSRDSWYKR